ncbi:NACHT domain-containing protein [Calothrix sp. FACHB-156]|nr:NACHT domain-containing protein [Calothrix sp. FACHB-156]
MKKHPKSIDKDFPEKPFKKNLEQFSRTLLGDLDKIDRESNWSAEYFTPLDAEVEVQSGSTRKRQVTDLLNAIKSNKQSRVFLVLGDPGSGKSVSLRKLCRELLQESEKTGKVPLYINLREWEPKTAWNQQNPPTVQELYEFVVANLKSRGDVISNKFIRKYFEKMYEYGRLFIVLDSFDEIPAVLDEREGSWLINELSDVIYKFLSNSESRGILASRIFRRPTDNFDAKTILEIRPFTETKIVTTLQSFSDYDERLITQIFKERQEFVPIARNPFTAALISSYAQENSNTLPQTQAELYSSYIDRRLEDCIEEIDKKNLTKEKIIQCAIDIADTMLHNQTSGLEASVNDLTTRLPQHPVEDVVDILKFAKLGRSGSGGKTKFSFVHRRFNEYFVVKRLIERPDRVPQDAIPTDSRWRDALALYCEVAEESKAKEIANFCWSEIRKVTENDVDMRDPQFLRMIHCLRFLKEAFRARLNCIEDFQQELTDFIKRQIKNQKNLLLQKFAIEAVGLLRNEDIDEAIIDAMRLKNDWINETSLKSCRHLPKISNDLKSKLIVYIDSFEYQELINQKDDLIFSLKLSNGFNEIERFLKWRIFDLYCFLFAILLCFVITPVFTMLIITVIFIQQNYLKTIFLITKKSRYIDNWFYRFFYLSLLFKILFESSFLHEYANNVSPQFNFSILDLVYHEQSSKIEFFVVRFVILLLIPFYQFVYYLPDIVSKFSFRKLSVALTGILFIIVFLSFLLFIFYVLRNFIVIILIALIIFLVSMFVISLYKQFRDYLKLKKIKRLNKLSREQIAKEINSFETAWVSWKYLELLQNENLKPEGDWPDGKLPNTSNAKVTTQLARLEEKWLGLDR